MIQLYKLCFDMLALLQSVDKLFHLFSALCKNEYFLIYLFIMITTCPLVLQYFLCAKLFVLVFLYLFNILETSISPTLNLLVSRVIKPHSLTCSSTWCSDLNLV